FHLDRGSRQLGGHRKMFTFRSAVSLCGWDRGCYAAGPASAMGADAGKPSGVALVRHNPAGRAAALLEFSVHRGGQMPYLLRHAHAGNKQGWAGPDRPGPLSNAGRREAYGLLTQLRDYPISRILSSPTVRCLETVEPLAQ